MMKVSNNLNTQNLLNRICFITLSCFLTIVEKAAFAALDASEGEYEELEDDFMMLANEGQVALEVVEEEVKVDNTKKGILKDTPQSAAFDANEADFRSRDIQILTADDGEEDEEVKALEEYRLKMAALLPEAGSNFKTVFEN